MKNIKLTWETSFETNKEVNEFINYIAMVHSNIYCCSLDVTYKPLIKKGKYTGARNKIKIEKDININIKEQLENIDTIRDLYILISLNDFNLNEASLIQDFIDDYQFGNDDNDYWNLTEMITKKYRI